MVNAILSYVTAALGLIAIVGLIWWSGRPNRMRESEDDARAFFDRHGHWPDEPPSPGDAPQA